MNGHKKNAEVANRVEHQLSDEKIILVGVIGILFGILGIHDFMLRRYIRAIIHLVLVAFGAFIIFVKPTWNTLLAWFLIFSSFIFGIIESISIFTSLSAKKANTNEKRRILAGKIALLYFWISIFSWILAIFFIVVGITPTTFGIPPNISFYNGMFFLGIFMHFALPAATFFLVTWFIAVLKSFKYDKIWLKLLVIFAGIILIGMFFFVMWAIYPNYS